MFPTAKPRDLIFTLNFFVLGNKKITYKDTLFDKILVSLPLICRQIPELGTPGWEQCRGISEPKPQYPYLGKKVPDIDGKR